MKKKPKFHFFLIKSPATILFWCLFAYFSAYITHARSDSLVTAARLIAQPHHERTIELVNFFVEKYHYKKTILNDNLSSSILDRYLKSLDPNKHYFLSADIKQFDKFRFELDDHILDNNLRPFFSIFNIYRDRVSDRMIFAERLLQKGFNFAVDEYHEIDRTMARWPSSMDDLNELWRLRVKNDYLSLKLDGQSSKEIEDNLKNRYQQVARRTLQIGSNDVFQILTNSYTSAIEPHTSYFSPRATENFKIRMRLSLEGIGAVLETINEYTVIQRVVPGGPADLDGRLQAGDKIIGVSQGSDTNIVDVVGWRLDDVVDLIRGPKSTNVRLKIQSNSIIENNSSSIISLTRDKIKLDDQAAQKKILRVHDGEISHLVGVITIPTFYIDFDAKASGAKNFRSTTRDVHRLIDELKKENIDGLIIDLRGNGGGALTEATSLTGLFIPSGPVVQVQNSRGKKQITRDSDNKIAYSGPLAVIIDRNSASASEIFSAAIQDYGRGVLVGESSFGKGTVQNLIDLDQYSENSDQSLGQLKLTIAQFFRINGSSTQFRGVQPDFAVPTANPVIEYGEKALTNALPWTEIGSTRYSEFEETRGIIEEDSIHARHKARILHNPDFNYLRGLRDLSSSNLEAKRISLLESQRENIREKRETQKELLLKNLQSAYGVNDKSTTNIDLPRDAVLLESAHILADKTFGIFIGRSIVNVENKFHDQLLRKNKSN